MQKLYQAYVCEQINQIFNGGNQWEQSPDRIADVIHHFCVENTAWADSKFAENAQMLFICNQLNGIKPLDSVQKFDHIICAEDGKYHLVSGFATKVNQMYCVCIKTDLATVDHCIATNLGEPDPYPQSEEFKQDGIPLGCWDINTSADETGVITTLTSSLRVFDPHLTAELNKELCVIANKPVTVEQRLVDTLTKIPRLKLEEGVACEVVQRLAYSGVHLVPESSNKTQVFNEPSELSSTVETVVYSGSREVYFHACQALRYDEDEFCTLARQWNFSKINAGVKLDFMVDSFVDKSGCTHYVVRLT